MDSGDEKKKKALDKRATFANLVPDRTFTCQGMEIEEYTLAANDPRLSSPGIESEWKLLWVKAGCLFSVDAEGILHPVTHANFNPTSPYGLIWARRRIAEKFFPYYGLPRPTDWSVINAENTRNAN